MEKIIHPIPPLYDGASKILILGSFSLRQIQRGIVFFTTIPKIGSGKFWPPS